MPAMGKNTYVDNEGVNLTEFFSREDASYVIKYHHVFSDTLFLPSNSKLYFKGGSLTGPIVFNDTKLCGRVDLKGSNIVGEIRNKKFDASWLCVMDGVTDDAPAINQMIRICQEIFFPKGQYRLKSKYIADDINGEIRKRIHSHLGINRSNVKLKGEKGACLISSEPLGMLTIYSQPYDIDNSIKNIDIENLTFKVMNDGINFHEFMLSIETMGVNGLTIKKCFFDDFWGDAICLSHYGDNIRTGERTRNQNVTIENNTIIGGPRHNNRNGISVINGKNVLIKRNIIKNTSRKNMPGGIDVEPNNPAYTLENIRIERNYLDSINGEVGAIAVQSVRKGAPLYNVQVIKNEIRNSRIGICVYIIDKESTDGIFIRNNYVDSNTKPYNFVGEGLSKNWEITDNVFEHPCTQEIPGAISVENLIVKGNKKKE